MFRHDWNGTAGFNARGAIVCCIKCGHPKTYGRPDGIRCPNQGGNFVKRARKAAKAGK